MRRESGRIWKAGREWKVQFPRGILTFKTKRVAKLWAILLKKEGK